MLLNDWKEHSTKRAEREKTIERKPIFRVTAFIYDCYVEA